MRELSLGRPKGGRLEEVKVPIFFYNYSRYFSMKNKIDSHLNNTFQVTQIL